MADENKAATSGNLDSLLGADAGARMYFSSLPGYVQEMIIQRRENIKSADDLRGYAENITQGDK